LEAAGLDPDSELVKQPFLVIMQEIQLIKAGIKPPPPSTVKSTTPKETSVPMKDEVRSKITVTDKQSSPESKTSERLELRIQDQYQTSLTKILGLWEKSITFQKSNLDHVCGFLNVQKYGLGEELGSYVNWATKATNDRMLVSEFSKEMKKRTESLQKLLNTSLPAGDDIAKKADKLRAQILKLSAIAEDNHLKMDELSKEMVMLFEKLGGEI